MKTRIKICGITNLKDAYGAADLGAYALGFIFYRGSKRYIPHAEARRIAGKLPPFIVKVGVFVNETIREVLAVREFCLLDKVQLHGNVGWVRELQEGISIVAYQIRNEKDIDEARKSPSFPLLDNGVGRGYGGTGKKFDWRLLKNFNRPYILAGGVSMENIDEAIALNPYAIDLASGVEKSPGVKDHGIMRTLFARINR
jgi:phosphoribosylanthranilate isomerase